ncbi:MAG: hypothetical protein ACRBCS_00810 [Cellvibrionaceae bacterium]
MSKPLTNNANQKHLTKNSLFPQREKQQSLKSLVILTVCLLACSLVTQNSEAQDSTIADGFFLPTDMDFFYNNGNLNTMINDRSARSNQNTTGRSDNHTHLWLANFARGLDNDDLLLTAKNLRNNDMSSSQRGHNYRWLQNNELDSPRKTKTFIRKMVSSALKTYWNHWRQTSLSENSLVPDADGKGKIQWQQTDINYRIKVSGDYIKLMFKMEFY